MNKHPDFLNQKFLYIMSVVCVLTITGLACNLPVQYLSSENTGDQQQDPDQIEAAIAETLIAMAPETQEIIESHDTESNESEIKEITATLTPSITPSPTITFTPTFTPTEEVAQGFISENTNCRIGPGDVYGIIHTFMAGDIWNNSYFHGRRYRKSDWKRSLRVLLVYSRSGSGKYQLLVVGKICHSGRKYSRLTRIYSSTYTYTGGRLYNCV